VVAFGHQPQPRKQRQQAAAGVFLQAPRADKVRLLEPALGEERIDDPLFVRPGAGGDLIHYFHLRNLPPTLAVGLCRPRSGWFPVSGCAFRERVPASRPAGNPVSRESVTLPASRGAA